MSEALLADVRFHRLLLRGFSPCSRMSRTLR